MIDSTTRIRFVQTSKQTRKNRKANIPITLCRSSLCDVKSYKSLYIPNVKLFQVSCPKDELPNPRNVHPNVSPPSTQLSRKNFKMNKTTYNAIYSSSKPSQVVGSHLTYILCPKLPFVRGFSVRFDWNHVSNCFVQFFIRRS